MTTLAPEGGALRTRLTEGRWAAAVATVVGRPLPGWAAPNLPASDPDTVASEPGPVQPDEDSDLPDLADALALRSRAALVVDVATTAGPGGVLAELTTDLTTVVSVARRVRVPDGPSPGLRLVHGVEVSVAPVDRLLAEVLHLFPPVPAPERLEEVEVPEELTVSLARALRTGDRRTVDAVCEDQGWGAVPEVLRALVQELLGSATVTVRRPGAGPVLGRWMLTRPGWVELVRTRSETVRHVPRDRDDIARTLVTAIGGAVSAVVADIATATHPADPSTGDDDG